ncbi:hypothetical protein C7M84_011897, partial [Penaeus vannamei]
HSLFPPRPLPKPQLHPPPSPLPIFSSPTPKTPKPQLPFPPASPLPFSSSPTPPQLPRPLPKPQLPPPQPTPFSPPHSQNPNSPPPSSPLPFSSSPTPKTTTPLFFPAHSQNPNSPFSPQPLSFSSPPTPNPQPDTPTRAPLQPIRVTNHRRPGQRATQQLPRGRQFLRGNGGLSLIYEGLLPADGAWGGEGGAGGGRGVMSLPLSASRLHPPAPSLLRVVFVASSRGAKRQDLDVGADVRGRGYGVPGSCSDHAWPLPAFCDRHESFHGADSHRQLVLATHEDLVTQAERSREPWRLGARHPRLPCDSRRIFTSPDARASAARETESRSVAPSSLLRASVCRPPRHPRFIASNLTSCNSPFCFHPYRAVRLSPRIYPFFALPFPSSPRVAVAAWNALISEVGARTTRSSHSGNGGRRGTLSRSYYSNLS